jgi:hypothetical protein
MHARPATYGNGCPGFDLSPCTLKDWRGLFVRECISGGLTLAEVKAAAGHASLLTLSVYLHVVVEREEVGVLFGVVRRAIAP